MEGKIEGEKAKAKGTNQDWAEMSDGDEPEADAPEEGKDQAGESEVIIKKAKRERVP